MRLFNSFLQTWIPFVIVLATVIWILHHNETEASLTVARVNERQAVQLASQTIQTELSLLRSDVLYLAEQISLQRYLETGRADLRQRVEADFLNFAHKRGLYDQIRFLDETGQEVVRINWNKGKPEIVSTDKLQNKSNRYYTKATLALSKNEIYVSPFDLNVEHNAIEQPIKPMLRLGTPVFDQQGRKKGIIVLNYLGQHLLNSLRSVPSGDHSVWLLNSNGYWLIGPRPDYEFGFMYPERSDIRFGKFYAEAWDTMQADAPEGQQQNKSGLFTYAKISRLADLNSTEFEGWILITHMPAAEIDAIMAGHNRNFILAFVVLALLLALLSGLLAYHDQRRRKEEEKVRDSEVRFRNLVDSAPDAIVIVDPSGCIKLVNGQTENWFGYTRDELQGQMVEILVPERNRKDHITKRRNYYTSPITRSMGEGVDLFGLRKDGSEFPVEISLSPIKTDTGLLVIGIIRDITARKQAEAAKRAVEVRYQELVNNLPVGVYRNTAGPDGRFLELNPAMATIFEAESVEELNGHNVSDLYCVPAERKHFADKIMQQGYVKAEELHLKTLKGREFYAAITAVKRTSQTGDIYFDGIVEDISARKESELRIRQLNENLLAYSTELEAINRELESFSYSVSHDLRAPLRAMDGFSRTLLKEYGDSLDDKGKDRLGRIRTAAQRMASLIDDLLKLSRVSRSDVNRESVNLSKVADEVIELLQQHEPQRSIEFSIKPDLITYSDPRLVRVLMDNLLSNAWKFTSQRPDATIEIGSNTDGDECIYFVRDNGAGFDMTYIGKLFGAFQRLHDNSEFPGTGIGLATVQRVVRKHGGRVWAEGAVGKGATFYFTLQERGRCE